MDYSFNKQYVLTLTKNILNIDSPTGFTHNVMSKIGEYAKQLGYSFSTTQKGSGIIFVKGKNPNKRVVCAHIDTLGLMVRSIKPNGRLAVTAIGSPIIPTLDGEYCKIRTRGGKEYSGTILSTSPASHVYGDAGRKPREIDTIEVRIDEVANCVADVENLGIGTGDFVCIDTKTEITESGFIKSRFLDDKLSVGILFGVLHMIKEKKIMPLFDTYFMFSAYEEVGHGMAYLPEGISEVLAVDMGCIGEDLNCTEYDVSICAKDSSGPYDFEMTNRLIDIAKNNNIRHAVDIYPYYSSDVSAARYGGNDIKGALIGSGVHASHGMERAHYEGVENSMRLLSHYLELSQLA